MIKQLWRDAGIRFWFGMIATVVVYLWLHFAFDITGATRTDCSADPLCNLNTGLGLIMCIVSPTIGFLTSLLGPE